MTAEARETLLEMAAVIRTVFGVAHQSSGQATPPTDPPAAALREVVAADELPAVRPSIAVAAVPDLPAPVADPMPTGTMPQVQEAPAAYAGEVPALRLAPDPSDDVLPELRHAVLREIAFLDD